MGLELNRPKSSYNVRNGPTGEFGETVTELVAEVAVAPDDVLAYLRKELWIPENASEVLSKRLNVILSLVQNSSDTKSGVRGHQHVAE